MRRNSRYTQWIEGFVRTVIQDADIECKELVIDDIEESKRIFLLIDGKEYTIRTWSYRPYRTDENNQTCAETVPYTLYKMVEDEHGSHGETIIDSESKVQKVLQAATVDLVAGKSIKDINRF